MRGLKVRNERFHVNRIFFFLNLNSVKLESRIDAKR